MEVTYLLVLGGDVFACFETASSISGEDDWDVFTIVGLSSAYVRTKEDK